MRNYPSKKTSVNKPGVEANAENLISFAHQVKRGISIMCGGGHFYLYETGSMFSPRLLKGNPRSRNEKVK